MLSDWRHPFSLPTKERRSGLVPSPSNTEKKELYHAAASDQS
ncbi:hypothetical protein SD77_1185 [Bacillus badius]|uniref:Ribose 5-phosphate isomerase B n=1 Tax=Bacillus badius TaxID=1455 RepID=A0ABR5ASX9_BACBA|nr:hypothetical protein SD78_2791 [Bacillus badius]KIL77856.1 hypothetical protein SD77_1185 [Bacillus badius]